MAWFGFGRGAQKPLRLIAETQEDVRTLAALVQDAALRAGDLAYDTDGRHFTLRMNRFCHEAKVHSKTPLRAPSVLRLSSVTRVKVRGFDPKLAAQPLSLLDIEVEAGEAPSAVLILRFAGDGHKDVRIDAECIDLLLLDLAAPRRARLSPDHPLD